MIKKFGGDEENRTPDPLLARQVLSQLSYTPTLVAPASHQTGRHVIATYDGSSIVRTLPLHFGCIDLPWWA